MLACSGLTTMKLALKNPAPIGPNLTRWGDYHFGLSLQRALEAAGHTVVQHYWPEWKREDGEDVILVLRGKRRFHPPEGKLCAIWVVSHPSTVPRSELDSYDLVFLASSTHCSLLEKSGTKVLRQCTDPALFFPPGSGDSCKDRRGIIFVADSRGIRRPIAQWAVESEMHLGLVGRSWAQAGLGNRVLQEYIPNPELPVLYRMARLSLNDHWGDMNYFGYINNRIFDCIACGLPVLTDRFPELREVCGDGLLYADDGTSFQNALREYHLNYPEVLERTRQLWQRISGDFTFEARAAEILDSIEKTGLRATRTRLPEVVSGNVAVAEAFRGACRLISKNPGEQIQFLHLLPDVKSICTLSGEENVNYLSGSPARGPWHVWLDAEVTALGTRNFDIILLEQADHLQSLDEEHRCVFIQRVTERLNRNQGVMAVSTEVSEFCRELLLKTGLNIVDESPGWRMYRAGGFGQGESGIT